MIDRISSTWVRAPSTSPLRARLAARNSLGNRYHVLTEHWLFPKLGWRRYWAEGRGALNAPALAAWIGSMVVALGLRLAGVHLFFLFVPTYVAAGVIYAALASRAGAGETPVGVAALSPSPSPRVTAAPRPAPSGATAASGGQIWGWIAVAALAACFWLGLRIALDGLDGYAERHAVLKSGLGWPTLVYFVAGTLYVRARARR